MDPPRQPPLRQLNESQLRWIDSLPQTPPDEGPSCNVVLCAETGWGKTIVAVECTERIIVATREIMPERALAVVLAPTQALVHQQSRRFAQFSSLRVGVIYGNMRSVTIVRADDPIPDKKTDPYARFVGFAAKMNTRGLAKKFDVVVCTPQIMLDSLTDRTASLLDLAFLVFDEVHHVTGEHPYCKIARLHFELSLDEKPPRILGLSASLLKGKNETQAEEDGIQKLRLLNARLVLAESLQRSVEVSVNRVRLSREQMLLSNEIQGVRDQIERLVDLQSPNCQTYEHEYIYHVAQEFIRRVDRGATLTSLSTLSLTDSDHEKSWFALARLHNAALLNRFVGPGFAMNYIRQQQLGQLLGAPAQWCDPLALGEQYGQLLDGLIQTVCRHPQRTIVFVEFRWLANLLRYRLSQDRRTKDIKCDTLVGHGSTASVGKKNLATLAEENIDNWSSTMIQFDVAMSVGQQTLATERFEAGDVDVLISTPVGEEGLDIGVETVVRIARLVDARSLTQSRGRIRTDRGYFYVIEYDDQALNFNRARNQERMHTDVTSRLSELDISSPTSSTSSSPLRSSTSTSSSSSSSSSPMRSSMRDDYRAQVLHYLQNHSNNDSVSLLNLACQSAHIGSPVYGDVRESGEPHQRRFVMSASIPSLSLGPVDGDSCAKKQDAKQSAAANLVTYIRNNNE